MNTYFYDIKIRNEKGETYTITTLILDAAVGIYNQLKGKRPVIVTKRFLSEKGEEIEEIVDVEKINAQWQEILSKVQR